MHLICIEEIFTVEIKLILLEVVIKPNYLQHNYFSVYIILLNGNIYYNFGNKIMY